MSFSPMQIWQITSSWLDLLRINSLCFQKSPYDFFPLTPPMHVKTLTSTRSPWLLHFYMMMMMKMMMMMMMNCFCGMVVDRRKLFSLISSRNHCQRSLPSRISDTPRAGFERAQNLSSERSCAVVITSTHRHGAWQAGQRFVDLKSQSFFSCCIYCCK